jgi:hypothetical protein
VAQKIHRHGQWSGPVMLFSRTHAMSALCVHSWHLPLPEVVWRLVTCQAPGGHVPRDGAHLMDWEGTCFWLAQVYKQSDWLSV